MPAPTRFEPHQIRACDLEPEDVMLHRGRWRFVRDRWLPHHHPDALEDHDLTRREGALFRKYLATPGCWVLVLLQVERRSREPKTRIVPVRFYDLVTVQCSRTPDSTSR